LPPGVDMRPPKKKSPDKQSRELLFELDGDRISPATVDSLALLNLANSFFRLVVKVAEAEKLGLSLQGLRVVNKCAAVAVVPSNADSARIASARAKRIVSGEEKPPPGCDGLVTDTRIGLRSLPGGISAGFRHGKTAQTLQVPTVPNAESPWEMLELRVVPIRVGGKDPTVELICDSEPGPFTIKTGQDPATSLSNARKLGASLQKEVDVTAVACRGIDGRIAQGYIEDVFALQDGDPVAIWRSWFAAECQMPEDVDDVGIALGRYN
jgi:hypothetical protein